jgi:hypothetical protein
LDLYRSADTCDRYLAFAQPSLTAKKLRRRGFPAGAASRRERAPSSVVR